MGMKKREPRQDSANENKMKMENIIQNERKGGRLG